MESEKRVAAVMRTPRHASARSLIATVLVLGMLLLAGACGDDDNDESGQAGGKASGDTTIGVSLASPTIPLFVGMEKGIRAKAKELGVEVLFTEANEDPVQQLDEIQELISRDVDGLLVAPVDSEAIVPAYEQARDADMPIMSIARGTDPSLQDAFVGPNLVEMGQRIAKWTCEHVDGAATVAMVKGPGGASFVKDMEKGYKKTLRSECGEKKIVFETNTTALSADQGLNAAQDALTRHPDVDVIFAQNDDLAVGVVQALEEKNRAGDVVVTGLDATPQGLELLRKGQLSMTVALPPQDWGATGLEAIVKAVRGEKVPPQVPVETFIVDDSNVNELTQEQLQ